MAFTSVSFLLILAVMLIVIIYTNGGGLCRGILVMTFLSDIDTDRNPLFMHERNKGEAPGRKEEGSWFTRLSP